MIETELDRQVVDAANGGHAARATDDSCLPGTS
jgi:hypothetical protein